MSGPAKDFGGAAGVGIGGDDVSGAAGGKAPLQGFAGGALKRLNDFEDGGAFAGSEVKYFKRFGHGAVENAFKGHHVGGGKVDDVDVVANGGSVTGRVVVAVDLKGSAQAGRTLGDEGHQVLGHAKRKLSDAGRRMGSDGVEVAQGNDLETEGSDGVAQDFFAHLLGVAVGRLRGLNGGGLGNGQRVSLAVDGAGRAKNESALGVGALVVQ